MGFLLGCVGSTDSSDRSRTNPPASAALRIATSGDYAPFSLWPPEAPEPSGFSIDLARSFAETSGRRIEWVRFRWPELLTDLESNQFDLALSGVTVRADRSLVGRFSVPVTSSQALVLVPETSAHRDVRDLDHPSVRLAVNRGGHLESVARELFPAARVEAVDDNQDVLGRLEAGAADAVVTDSLEAPHWESRRPGLRRIGPLSQDRKAALVDPQQPELAAALDAWLLEAEGSGRLGRIRERYGLPAERTATPEAALLASLDERLSLMRSVARAKRVLGLPVEDRPRERRVLDSAWQGVERAARSRRRPPPEKSAVIDLFRAQIEAAKWIQRDANRSRESPAADAESEIHAREELDQRLRPALIRLGDQITRLIVATSLAGSSPPDEADVRRALLRHELPEDRIAALHAALVRTLTSAE